MDPTEVRTGRWRALAGVAGLALWTCLASAAERVVVLTSYPQEVFAAFETAFERANPDVDVDVLWRMPHDALAYLRGEGRGKIDVYWAASYRNFVALARYKLLLPAPLSSAPTAVGPLPLRDPEGFFQAVELAGYGLVSNGGYLAARGLPVPREWSDIADARYAGHVVLPIPSKVGFALGMIDVILQGQGWDAGWRLLSAIAANSALHGAGSGTVVDEVRAGRGGVGLTIDFQAGQAIANGAPLVFRYPGINGYSVAHAGLLAGAPNVSGGERFARFLVSAEGQALLAAPDLRKLPVRPDAYAGAGFGVDPFADPSSPTLRYDPDLGLRRGALVTALFDQFLTRRHAALIPAWRVLRTARQAAAGDPVAGAAVDAAESLLTAMPLTAARAGDPSLAGIFERRRRDPSAETQARVLEDSWAAFFDDKLAAATRLADDADGRLARR